MKNFSFILMVGVIALCSFTSRHTDGSIVIIDDDCIITPMTGSTILSVEFVNQTGVKVLDMKGCSDTNCHINIQSLPSSEYTVIVHTSDQSSFIRHIMVQ